MAEETAVAAQTTSGITYGQPFQAYVGGMSFASEVCKVFLGGVFNGQYVFNFLKTPIKEGLTVTPVNRPEGGG
ncbi:MAG TPA: hypothetical protein P5267_01275 [Patescibacteria group bacterium]|nr:hypothetical protein [Patescibacteria group bacterium]